MKDRLIFITNVLECAPVPKEEQAEMVDEIGRLYDLGTLPGEAVEYIRTFEEVLPERTEGEALAMRYTLASRIVKRVAERLQVNIEVLSQVVS